MKQATASYMKVSKELTKYNFDVATSYIEAGFQVCPCMSDEMLLGIRQKFTQLIADAYMTFQGTGGARHGAQTWQ